VGFTPIRPSRTFSPPAGSNDLICRRSAALCSSGLATPGLTAPG